MTRTFPIIIQRRDCDIAVDVDATWDGAYQDEPGRWDIDVIRDERGEVVEVAEDERRWIQEELDESTPEDFREF